MNHIVKLGLYVGVFFLWGGLYVGVNKPISIQHSNFEKNNNQANSGGLGWKMEMIQGLEDSRR